MVNSRNKWNSYERKLMNEYKELWWEDCLTSRNESKRLDDAWIDLCYTDPLYIQAKNYTSFSWAKIIETIKWMLKHKTNFNILHLKITGKWEVVCMSKEDWYRLIKTYNLKK